MDQLDAYKTRLGYLESRSLRRLYFDDKIGGAVTEDAVKAEYDTYVAGFEGEEEIRARHILVTEEADANAIKTELDNGGSFEDIAKEKSIDPGSGQNGGDLGFFGKGQMVPEFEAAAFDLEIGAISAPVQSQFGWHIIKLEEKRKSEPVPYEQAAQQLSQKVLFDAYNKMISGLKADTEIVIEDPALAAKIAAQESAE
ncbi:MAG: peptidylprolyl isomerase, partial [Anaerolineae bacterium]|nr:peptidylprolyl isomerase [Anaerolineae bacterium]